MKSHDVSEERDTWYAFGLARLSAGEVDAAIRCFDRALEIDPAFAEAARMREKALLNPGSAAGVAELPPRYEAAPEKEDEAGVGAAPPVSRRRSRKTAKILRFLRTDKHCRDKVAHIERLPSHKPACGIVSPPLPGPLAAYLEQKEIRLYTHQCEAIERIRGGNHIILTTPTASGKTLAFNIPIFEILLNNPRATALYIYPIKALANDQYKTLKEFEAATRIIVNAERFDGDTPGDERDRIRCTSKVILTNPYELHYMLGTHRRWASFFAGLKCIVVDEAHTYRGVFGSNVALVFRRLERICAHYGSDPQFILSSATIANPEEFGGKLVGRPVVHISRDGSPRGSKHFVLYNPKPEGAKEDTVALSVHNETVKLLAACVRMETQTLCFARSRQLVELVALWTKEALRDDYPHLAQRVRSYRGGYLPEDRLRIEQQIKDGSLLGIVSTNALELGIDIGSLDCVILSGYPGTMMSTWQQAGRAGRRATESVAIMVAYANPLEQHFTRHPEDFFARPHENAVLDLENRYIRADHILCAAQELPLEPGRDREAFGDTIMETFRELAARGDLRQTGAGWTYAGSETWPHGSVRLNSISSDSFLLMHGHRLLETLDPAQAFREAHPGAVFLHDGQTYIVDEFDPEKRVIRVRYEETDYYTRAAREVSLRVTRPGARTRAGSIDIHTGDVVISESYTGYRVIKHEKVINEISLDLPPLHFETRATWFSIPVSPNEPGLSGAAGFERGLRGLENVIPTILPYFIMCDARDINVHAGYRDAETGAPTVYVYDNFVGGIGLSEKVAGLLPDILAVACRLVADCRCESGCPSCIYTSSYMSEGDVDKRATQVLLERLRDTLLQAQIPS